VIQQNKELVENGEELRKAKEQAENASRMKTTFIQSMSHEIRTPLNSIVGFSQVLSNYFKEEDNDEIREFASIIEISSSNLLRLINDVLDISYLDQSEILPYDKPEDINNCCLLQHRTNPEQYKERGITPFRTVMRTTYDIDQPGKGSADTDPLATQRN